MADTATSGGGKRRKVRGGEFIPPEPRPLDIDARVRRSIQTLWAGPTVDGKIEQVVTDMGGGSGPWQPQDADLTEIAALANVAGDILYTNATPEWARLPKGSNGQFLTLASGIPAWATVSAGGGWQDDGTVVRPVTTTDQICIGTDTPNGSNILTVVGTADVSSSLTCGALTVDGNIQNLDGTLSISLTTDAASNQLAIFRGNGGTTADGDEAYFTFQLTLEGGAGIKEFCRITWQSNDVTNASEDGEFRFAVMVAGTLTDELTIKEDGIVAGAATGGAQGFGTINAVGVYDDSVLLTDYIFDLYFDGHVRLEDEGRHGTKQLVSIDETLEFCRTERHLPSIPGRKEWEQRKWSLGDLVTSLWETVERQSLHIFALHSRLKALEEK